MRALLRGLGFALAALSAAACSPKGESVTVFAAASLIGPLESIESMATSEGLSLRVSHAGSATLARQILQGAPADLFVSADSAWIDRLERAELVVQRRTIARNRLVLVSSVEGSIESVSELGGDSVRRIAIADPLAAPAGRYAKAYLEELGMWVVLEPKLVMGKDVRQALDFVAMGEVPVGIVYLSDAIASDAVVVVEHLETEPILYEAAQIRSKRDSKADRLFDLLASAAAQRIYVEHGLQRVDEDADEPG